MASILNSIEYGLGRLLFNVKAHDNKLFTKGPAFASLIEPTFEVNSPDCGPSNSIMKLEYTQLSEDRFPELKWSTPSPDVKEYLLVVEDADAPLPFTPTHGLYYSIPAATTTITNSDVRALDLAGKETTLNGGFRLGKNLRGTVYGGPRPVMGHGPHRYYYQLIALKEPVDVEKLSAMATKKELAEEIVGKVAGWGVWIGVFERKWEWGSSGLS